MRDKNLLTLKELAQDLGVSDATLRYRVVQGTFPPPKTRRGVRLYYTCEEVEALVRQYNEDSSGDLWDFRRLSEALGLHVQTLRNRVDRGTFPGPKVSLAGGKRKFYTPEEAEKLIAEHREKAEAKVKDKEIKSLSQRALLEAILGELRRVNELLRKEITNA